MAKPTGNPNGRPTAYTQKLGDKILEQFALGKTARQIAKQKGMPAMSTLFKWLRDVDGFSEQYFVAKQVAAIYLGEEVIEIADNSLNDFMEDEYMKGKTPGFQLNGENIQRAKLRVDTRLKLMSKLLPKKYGEKLDVVSDGEKLEGLIIIKDHDGKS